MMKVLHFCGVWGVSVLLFGGSVLMANEEGDVPQERELPFELPDFGLDPDPDEPSAPELRSLIIRRADADLMRYLPPHADGLVYISGLPLLDTPRFRRTARSFLGRSLTDENVEELGAEIERTYRRNRRPVVEVTVPHRDRDDGHLVLEVREGRVGQVRVSGNTWFRRAIFTSKSRFLPGDEIDSVTLQEDIDWMNRNPFRNVEASFAPGREPGEVDVVYEVDDRFPFRVYGGFENTGPQVLGEERFLAGFDWGHLMAMDHELHYEASAGRYFDRIYTHSASYVAPLPSRHELTVFGHYSDVDVETEAFPGNLEGENLEIGARYTIFLAGLENPDFGTRFSHEFAIGADFKRAETAAEFGRAEVFDPATEIIQGVGRYSGTLRDPFGRTEFDATLFYSPGNFLSERNRDPVFEEARTGARTKYHYTRLRMERESGIENGLTLLKRGVYQYSNRRLLPSEQLGVGGYTSVRGYEERAANGDRGFLLSAELRTPEFNLGETLGIGTPGPDRWQLLGFVDYGMAEIRGQQRPGATRTYLLGAGPGLRMRVDDHFFLRFDYAWQLREDALPGDTRDHRAHAAIILSY